MFPSLVMIFLTSFNNYTPQLSQLNSPCVPVVDAVVLQHCQAIDLVDTCRFLATWRVFHRPGPNGVMKSIAIGSTSWELIFRKSGDQVLPSLKPTVRPWKRMVGILFSFWDDLLSGAMAVSFREGKQRLTGNEFRSTVFFSCNKSMDTKGLYIYIYTPEN